MTEIMWLWNWIHMHIYLKIRCFQKDKVNNKLYDRIKMCNWQKLLKGFLKNLFNLKTNKRYTICRQIYYYMNKNCNL